MKRLIILISILVAIAGLYLYRLTAGYETRTICVVVTSDLGGRIELLPRALTLIEEVRRSCEGEVIAIDNGGLLRADTAGTLARTGNDDPLPEARFLAAAGYDLINVTPDLFRFGAQRLRRLLHEGGVAAVTGNLHGLGGATVIRRSGLSVAVQGVAAPAAAFLMPPDLFDGVHYDDPFEGGTARRIAAHGDLSILLLNADLADLADRFDYQPADILLALNARFPHPALFISNARFPAELLDEAGGGTRFATIDPRRPALLLAKVRTIVGGEGAQAVISGIETVLLPFEGVTPEPGLQAEIEGYRRVLAARTAETVATPWFLLDLNASRAGDTTAARLHHESLFAIAAAAGYRPVVSLALTPQGSFRKEGGPAPIARADIGMLVPRDRFPVMANLSGQRIAELLTAAWNRYPDAAASLFPFAYTIAKNGALEFADRRFSPDTIYPVVMDGGVADLLQGREAEEGAVVRVLPETLGEHLAQRMPIKLSYIFTPFWKSE